MLEMFGQGSSLAQYLAEIGKSKSTFYEWIDKRPDFAKAYEIAKIKGEAYWDQKGQENVGNPDFNYGHLRWLMGNRYGTSSRRKSRYHKYINPNNLMGSFKKLAKMNKDGDMDIEELRQYVGVLMDLATLKEKEELEQRIKLLEDSLKEQNEPACAVAE